MSSRISSSQMPSGDPLDITTDLFFTKTGLDQDDVSQVVRDALHGADDGELFLEERHSEVLVFDDGRMKSSSYDNSSGFGLRSIAGEAHGYAHSGEMTIDAIKRAGETVRAVTSGYDGTLAMPPKAGGNRALYTSQNPLEATAFGEKVTLLQEIDAYARAADPLVKQVSVSVA